MASRAVSRVKLHLLRRFRFKTCTVFTGSSRGVARSRTRSAGWRLLALCSSWRTRSSSARERLSSSRAKSSSRWKILGRLGGSGSSRSSTTSAAAGWGERSSSSSSSAGREGRGGRTGSKGSPPIGKGHVPSSSPSRSAFPGPLSWRCSSRCLLRLRRSSNAETTLKSTNSRNSSCSTTPTCSSARLEAGRGRATHHLRHPFPKSRSAFRCRIECCACGNNP